MLVRMTAVVHDILYASTNTAVVHDIFVRMTAVVGGLSTLCNMQCCSSTGD